jgi:hypothetical protein
VAFIRADPDQAAAPLHNFPATPADATAYGPTSEMSRIKCGKRQPPAETAARDRVQLVVTAYESGLIDPEPHKTETTRSVCPDDLLLTIKSWTVAGGCAAAANWLV